MAAIAPESRTDAFMIPPDSAYEELWDGSQAPFIPGPDIEYRADVLIGTYPELGELVDHPIRYLWGRKERKKRGKLSLGYTYLHNPELRWLTECEATIVLCGANMRAFGLSDQQMEAGLYHELKHLCVSEGGKLTTRDHDVYMFYDEIRRYGLYLKDLERVGEVVRQAELPLGVPKGGRA